MISSRQIKAARALLGWTQGNLAQVSGLHLNAINKIENDQGEPRSSTLERIKVTCESHGIRFRGQRGVELKEDVFEVARYEGAEFLRRATDDILAFLRGPEDELLYCVADERIFETIDREQNERYYKHMKKTGCRERFLTSQYNHAFINPDKNAHRWLPEKALGTVTYAIYSNRVLFVNWQTREALIVKSASLAATFKGQFEFLWSQAKTFSEKPPHS